MFYTILSSIIDKYMPSWVQRWRTGATVAQRKAGHDVVQFDHFGQGRHGDGALVVATAPSKHKTKNITYSQLQPLGI